VSERGGWGRRGLAEELVRGTVVGLGAQQGRDALDLVGDGT
jgi:hypothetical protein